MSNLSNIVSLNITKFPQNLLIPGMDNDVSIQATNNSEKKENFSIVFEGENLDITDITGELKEKIEFAPKETKNFDIRLNPTASGYGKLTINSYWLKVVEYTVKIQKIREVVPKTKLNKILEGYKFKGTEKIETINPKDYLQEMSLSEIQKVEEQLNKMKKNYDSSLSSNSTSSGAFSKVTIEVIDKTIKELAKGYLSNKNLNNALGTALELSDSNDRINFYTNIIRTYALDNINQAIQIVNGLNDLNLKESLLYSLVYDQISQNPIQALNLIDNIANNSMKLKLLFNTAKKLIDNNKTSESFTVFEKLVDIILNSIEIISEDKKVQKSFNDSLKNAIFGIAEIDTPASANSIIEGIENQMVKENVSKELFDDIYELVEEIRTKLESELVFSQFFLLNTYTSNINNEIKSFSSIGGNVSNNILSRDYNFPIIILSLFSFNFSIFPIIDRVYNDLKFNSNKSMGYYIFPSIKNFQNDELRVLQKTLGQLFDNFSSTHSQLLIFNLDFIPYLGKPTVIISSESQLNNTVKSKIERLSGSINLIIDDSMFKGGKIYDDLKEIVPPNKGEIINLILSYEFINDYNLLVAFIQSLC
ncbi:MAG: hypothetical protein ACFFA3_19660 [Promethearchaeota archaeon]